MPELDLKSLLLPSNGNRPKPSFLSDGRRVGLLPQKGWAWRNYRYLSGSLLPAMMSRRERNGLIHPPSFPSLAPDQVEVVWIGHASFLLRTASFNALVDPVWAKWMGPVKRHRDPGIDIEHLPPIDLVLITHAHFDHLCRMTLKRIADGNQTVIVPRGVAGVLRRLNFREVIEMTDWEKLPFRNAEIHFTPAHHWGARYLHDNHKGFGGYVVKVPGHSIYHSGDSAYFDGFAEIGDRLNPDTALLPIGAYDCPSGREVHMNPEEALRAFFDLKAHRMMPMHHGTFPLSNEKRHEPLERLLTAVESLGLESRVISPREGEQILLTPASF